MTHEQIARITYAANRAYAQSLGDNSFAEEWEPWQKATLLKGVDFHFSNLEIGVEPSPSESHESWLAEKVANGWKYGPVKDPEKKEHPCMVAYESLPIEQRMKDYLFSSIVKAFWEAERKEMAA
jgi:hypothetical protein